MCFITRVYFELNEYIIYGNSSKINVYIILYMKKINIRLCIYMKTTSLCQNKPVGTLFKFYWFFFFGNNGSYKVTIKVTIVTEGSHLF